MTYRGKRRNLTEPISADKVRALTSEKIVSAMEGAEFVGQILQRLGITNTHDVRLVLMKHMEDLGISYGSLKVDSRRLMDLTGQTFGHLEVIQRAPSSRSGCTMWLCREIETGIVKPVAATHLVRGNTKSFTRGAKKGPAHSQWRGVGDISGNYWHDVQRKARTRQLVFELTIEDAWLLFLEQGRRCALSGLPLYFPETGRCPYTASLDRIDSSKGYIRGNVQWVHVRINLMKNRFPESEFIAFCKAVAAKHADTV